MGRVYITKPEDDYWKVNATTDVTWPCTIPTMYFTSESENVLVDGFTLIGGRFLNFKVRVGHEHKLSFWLEGILLGSNKRLFTAEIYICGHLVTTQEEALKQLKEHM